MAADRRAAGGRLPGLRRHDLPAAGSGAAMTGYLVRPAAEADLDALVAFEIEIAVVSFADEAVTDPAMHRKRVSRALGQPGEVTLVAVAAADHAGMTQLTGKVHAANLGMRALYRKFGFTATHLTMERRGVARP